MMNARSSEILQVWANEGSLKRENLAQARFWQKPTYATRLLFAWNSLKQNSTAQQFSLKTL